METMNRKEAWRQTRLLMQKGNELSSEDLSDELLLAWIAPESLWSEGNEIRFGECAENAKRPGSGAECIPDNDRLLEALLNFDCRHKQEAEEPGWSFYLQSVFFYALGWERSMQQQKEEKATKQAKNEQYTLRQIQKELDGIRYGGMNVDELYACFRGFVMGEFLNRRLSMGAGPIRLLDFEGYREELSRLKELCRKKLAPESSDGKQKKTNDEI